MLVPTGEALGREDFGLGSAFPPQGEGGPLCVPCGYAVDEVPARCSGFPAHGEDFWAAPLKTQN